MKNKQYIKILQTSLIALGMIIYIIGWYIVSLIYLSLSVWQAVAGAIIPTIICGIMIYVTIERIQEIRGGETDDLSQY